MKLHARLLEHPAIYQAWQFPFTEVKLRPVFKHNDMDQVRRVLDLGCGPGTNTRHFLNKDYVGIDINPLYVEYAKTKYKKPFLAADITKLQQSDDFKFDFVLLNSFLHHIDDKGAAHILSEARKVIAPDGCIHILDMLIPEGGFLPNFLQRRDRGEYFRPIQAWKDLFERAYIPLIYEPFSLDAFGVHLWDMIYFKGKPIR